MPMDLRAQGFIDRAEFCIMFYNGVYATNNFTVVGHNPSSTHTPVYGPMMVIFTNLTLN